ncbi:hypothetical protein LXA43DRAFT_1001285 [Ganoderma leucocontextum]|nr:hypothetical protein LXA43DRAFT_1001285 [Ganoderma leucocontextum]
MYVPKYLATPFVLLLSTVGITSRARLASRTSPVSKYCSHRAMAARLQPPTRPGPIPNSIFNNIHPPRSQYVPSSCSLTLLATTPSHDAPRPVFNAFEIFPTHLAGEAFTPSSGTSITPHFQMCEFPLLRIQDATTSTADKYTVYYLYPCLWVDITASTTWNIGPLTRGATRSMRMQHHRSWSPTGVLLGVRPNCKEEMARP